MNILKITSPIPPSVNHYLHHRVQRARNGRLFVQPFKPKRTIEYEEHFFKIVTQAIEEQQWEIPDKDKFIIIRATFYFPQKGLDINNHWKLPLDVFKSAGVYLDDSQVIEGAKRQYIDKNNPRIEFDIWVAPFIGIFNNKEQLDEFKNVNCRFCKKEPEKCTILKQAYENRITGDIDMGTMICNKRKPIVK